jgi:DNA ligase-1
MNFEIVAGVFSQIESTSKRLEMTEQLAKLLGQTPASDIRLVVYLIQGRLAPAFEDVEAGMGEKFVILAIAKTAGYSKTIVEKEFKKNGDLGQTAENLLGKKTQRSLVTQTVTVAKVHQNFLKMAHAEGTGSQTTKIRLLSELLNSASPLEAKYITRFALGSLRLGVGDPTIMDSLARVHLNEFKEKNPKLVEETEGKDEEEKDRRMQAKLREKIESKYNIYSDLGRLAEKLSEKKLEGLKDITIEPGIPIRPTLAERLPASKDIIEKLGKCMVEMKYDGFRIQLHKKGKKIWIFSRNQENLTSMFPEIVTAAQKQLNAHSCIVEGETLALNEETNEFYPFQITIQRRRKYDIEEKAKELPLRLFLFDALAVGKNSLLGSPFRERREKLKKLIAKGETIELTQAIITDDPKEIDEFFLNSVTKGLEGIVAKDLNAPYIAGARKYSWIKLKRSYKGELQDSVDLVILGFYKGKGKRTVFGLGGLLAGVYDEKTDEFKSVTKIGTGFSEQMLSDLNKLLSKHITKKRPARVDSEIEPDFWVEPVFVVEAVADEITKSPMHTAGRKKGTGYALRFPRIIKLRSDKTPEQATSVKEIIHMHDIQKNVKVEEFR